MRAGTLSSNPATFFATTLPLSIGGTMIELFKLAFELILAAAIFVGGVFYAIKFPNGAAKIQAVLSGLLKAKAKQ